MSAKNFLAQLLTAEQLAMDESAVAAEANDVAEQAEEKSGAQKGGFINNLLDDS